MVPALYLTLALVAFPAHGSRKLRTREEYDPKAHLNDAEAAGTTYPDDIMVDLVEGLIYIDWSEDIGTQMEDLAITTVETALSMINPLLGLSFSLLFGTQTAPDYSALIKAILEQVEKMIQQALNDFRIESTHTTLTQFMNKIDNPYPDWEDIENSANMFLVDVFKGFCWDDDESDKCKDWQLDGGAARALQYELLFMDLYIHCQAEMKREGGYDIQVRDATHYIRKASPKLDKHVARWSEHRMKDSMFGKAHERDDDRRRRMHYNPRRRRAWKVQQGWDKLEHGEDRRRSDMRRRGNQKDEFSGKFCKYTDTDLYTDWKRDTDRCREGWFGTLRGELYHYRVEADAVRKASFVNYSHEMRRRATSGGGHGTDYMRKGQQLFVNQKLTGPNGMELIFTATHLAVNKDQKVLWHQWFFANAYRLVFQGNGDLAVYDKGGKFVWHTNTPSSNYEGSVELVQITEECQLVVWSNGGVKLWNSPTRCPDASGSGVGSDRLKANASHPYNVLVGGQRLVSNSNPNIEVGIKDGELQITKSGNRIGGRGDEKGHRLAVVPSGNLILYDEPGHVLWCSAWETSAVLNFPNSYWAIQGDCNLCWYNNGPPALWCTKTQCG